MIQKIFFKWCPFYLALFVILTLTVTLSHQFSDFPALGPLLSPFTGFWKNTPIPLKHQIEVLDWPELNKTVTVQWDEYGVPHIFAKNPLDLYRVQGFIHARHRLFQMEVTSRAGEGRLSELLGDKTLSTDLFFVNLGMRQAVQNSLDNLLADTETRESFTAYSEGVNRYIDSLNSKSLPVEYKLLGASPKKWTPRSSIAIFMAMTFRLAGRSYDVFLTRHAQKHGWEKLKPLFPQFLSDDLIIPYPSGENNLPKGSVQKGFDQPFLAKVNLDIAEEYIQPFATNGSNNWAFSGESSKDQHTWLANDTHLNYSLPAIFYEQQLITPNFNVYGASIIGSAGLQIGFHKSFGWAVTNGNSDVLDWYEVEFKEDFSDKYLFDKKWFQLEKSTDTVSSRSGQKVVVTHEWGKFGKIYRRDGKLGLAFRWMGHEAKNELKTFLNLTQAKNHKDCLEAVKYYHVPIQNLICASSKKLSIIHMGKAPKRTRYSGALVKNGRQTDPEWQELIEYSEMPQSHHPKQGYVFSANQRIAPKNYKYYLNWDWEESYRASQIEKGLKSMKGSPDFKAFKDLQSQIYSPHANELLPLLLDVLFVGDLNKDQKQAIRDLSTWDYHARADDWEMSLFYFWWKSFEETLFRTHFGPRVRNAYPKARRTVQLVRDLLKKPETIEPAHFWFLKELSQPNELKKLLIDKVNKSFHQAWEELSKKNSGDYTSWKWKETRPTRVPHILRILALSSLNVPKSGGRYTVDVNTGSAGAVWRQIVRIGENFQAWTNFPGGPSGNPFSKLYDSQVEGWAENQYRQVRFLTEPMETQE